MFNKTAILATIIIFFILTSYSQADHAIGIDMVASNFIKMIRSEPKEKINACTDKRFYQAGEEIWFRAYCLDALSGKPLSQSRQLFVDLVNDKDSVINQILINLSRGATGSKFSLPQSLKEGYYWMRAYTKRMLHGDSSGIFVKPVYVFNGRRPDPRIFQANTSRSEMNQQDSNSPRLVFYPEGGAIISGTTSTIAFRSQTASGKSIDVSGFVTDSRDSTVCTFNTTLPGIGKFSFDAWNRRKYIAHIRWGNKEELSYPLPAIDQFASQISLLDQSDGAFHFRVSQGDSLYKKNKSTYLLGVSRDSLCFAANGTDMYDVNIPKSNFPKGKATLYLFDELGQMLSQRSVYVDSTSIRIITSADKSNYGPREKVKVGVHISGADNIPIQALFSVSVTDDRLAMPPEQLNHSWYSDNVFLPRHGLGQDKRYSPEEMDLIMLTQEGTYPNWKYADKINPPPPKVKENEDEVYKISGSIMGKMNDPLGGYLVNLFDEKRGLFRVDTTDAKGRFQFNLPEYEDSTKFNLKLTNMQGAGQTGKIILDHPNFPRFGTPALLKKRFNSLELEELRKFRSLEMDALPNAAVAGALAPVTVEGINTSYDESKRVSRFSIIIPSEKLSTGDPFAVVNAIKNVPGFNFGVQSMTIASAANTSMGTREGDQPLVVVDGVKETISTEDVNSFLMSIDPYSIDFIEVLKGAQTAIYGMEGAGGVILINTINKRKYISEISENGLTAIYAKGYSKETPYPNPNYDNKDVKKSTYPDLRSTVFWKANFLTDKNGNASLEFFTADEATIYTVTLTGVTNTGELIYNSTKISRK